MEKKRKIDPESKKKKSLIWSVEKKMYDKRVEGTHVIGEK